MKSSLFEMLSDRGQVLILLDNYGISKGFGWVAYKYMRVPVAKPCKLANTVASARSYFIKNSLCIN